MIPENLKTDIEIAIIEQTKNYQQFSWQPIDKGYTNEKYLISGNEQEPLAVCKIFSKNEIYQSELRFEREKHALELFGGDIAPKIIWANKSGILVYEYLLGQELHLVDYNLLDPSEITNIIEKIHRKSKEKRNAIKEDVIKYYIEIAELFESSKDDYPPKLIEKLKKLTNIQVEIIDEYSEYLTHVHGDLIPPNFIVNESKIKLLDWEFSRPELTFFDFQYFNYYAEAHDIPVRLNIKAEIKNFYSNIVDVLERLWRHGYLKKNKNIFYYID